MQMLRKLGAVGAFAAVLLVGAGSASAVPALQLGPGSSGGWSYDLTTGTWVAADGSFELAAYAVATSQFPNSRTPAWFPAGLSQKLAYLVVSAAPGIAPPPIGFDGFDVTIANDSAVLSMYTSGYGSPPLEDGDDIRPHEDVYPTYYEVYEFNFDGAQTVIPDTLPGATGTANGFAELFQITVNSNDPAVGALHFDLFTLTNTGKFFLPDDPNVLPNPNFVNQYAFFDRDAQTAPLTAPIPEPGSTLLFGVGCLVAGIAGRRRAARRR
jgi:hypothetical protein